MKIIFNIEYHTFWGQILYISGNLPSLGEFKEEEAVAMRYNGNGKWTYELETSVGDLPVEYRYLVKEYDRVYDVEWGKSRLLSPGNKVGKCVVYDSWSRQPDNKSFFSSAFVHGIFARQDKNENLPPYQPGTLILYVFAPMVQPGNAVGVIDRSSGWNTQKIRVLNDAHYPIWMISIPVKEIDFPYEFKFVILDKNNHSLLAWEEGDNRFVDTVKPSETECVIKTGMMLNDPFPKWKGSGVAIPVFSLRSEKSMGIGDFYDLQKMVDWAADTGMQFIQILPVNDTTMTHTWVDSYPYNANSTFALHPNYLRVEAVGRLKDKDSVIRFEKIREELDALSEIDYERVSLTKEAYLKEIFKQDGDALLQSDDFKLFFKENCEWLIPYAAFCYFRDYYHTSDFTYWKEYSIYNRTDIEEFCAPGNVHYYDIAYHYFVQYHLAKQLKETRDYAHKKRVVLKGDIPIGISRSSADAWSHPELFNMHSQAGAPPDAFSVKGQNWGFPTYNWYEMERDGYAWWKARFCKMSEYFDAYRIDHILGFFRIWEIPQSEVEGLMGHFNPALPYSYEEMQSFGFYFNLLRHARPYIREYMLPDFFGEYVEEAKYEYLISHNESYSLKSEFDTQRKIEEYFHDKTDEKSLKIKAALFGLVAEVLFVEDPIRKNQFHPRISSQYTYSYKDLSDYEKWCYDRLYNEFFYHRHNEFWKHEAMKKLPPLISATQMLPCGEDLGMIPHSVPEVMQALQILSLEIQRMPKDNSHEFANTWNYPYLSVCTTSTHDMSNIRAWWEEDRGRTQRFYNEILQLPGEAPFYCEPWICDKIIDMQLQSPSMLVILPLQDWLSVDSDLRRENPTEERINIPANPRHYWRYRMHLTIEDLINAQEFNNRLKRKIIYFSR